MICYALKANSHLGLLKNMAVQGLGADVVSGGELGRALEAGFLAAKIVFSGVGKTEAELRLAIGKNIGQINAESLPELERIAKIARESNFKVRVALRLNPDVTASTHQYVTTGGKENKFGLDMAQVGDALNIFSRNKEFLEFHGLAVHIGSQLIEIQPIVQAVERLKEVFLRLRSEGWLLKTFDIGGGLGIDYATNDESGDQTRLVDYARRIEAVLHGLEANLVMEPGRFLVARAGVLLTRVEFVKKTPHQTFVIVNSGINHLMRPALYQAVHRILPVVLSPGRSSLKCDIVGPICESSDVLGSAREIEAPVEGEWLAILDTGAYGYSMANQYNLRPLPEEILNA